MTNILVLPGVASVPADRSWMPALTILAVGAAIAAVAPFDRAFEALTIGSPIARVTALVAVVLAGFVFAAKVGARVESHDLRHPLITPLAIDAAVAVGITTLDAWVFRPILAPGYVAFVSETDLPHRLAYFMLRAFNESILYRLFLSSVLVWAIGRFWRRPDGLPANGAFWLGMGAAQVINIAINVTFLDGFATTPALLVH